jgi:two-component system phosphate regulon sensor histidine kinase PhoR
MSTESLVATAVSSDQMPGIAEFEDTLKRLVDRVGKILQAESCVFVLHEPEKGELRAVEPALGLSHEQVLSFRAKVTDEGLTAEVFRTGIPVILYNAARDPRAIADGLASKFGAQSAVCVPLIKELRDDENNVISRSTIGVLYVFNKLSRASENGAFVDEDVNLLLRMSTGAAGIISSAKVFQDVVAEKQELIHTIESLYIGLVVIATNRRILQINPSARLILKLADDDSPIGRPYTSVINHPVLLTLLDRSLSKSVPIEVNGEISIPVDPENYVEGDVLERIYQVQCAPVRGDNTDEIAGIVVLLNDITEIRGVDRMKTAFISTVSHELRTPLTSIKGFIATLLADKEGFYDAATQREFYSIIDSECDRLTRLIDDLLSASRIEQGKALEYNFEPLNVAEVIHTVVISQSASISSSIHTLIEDFQTPLPQIQADKDRFNQIMTNVIGNAIKYSPAGGKITVSGLLVNGGRMVQIRVSDEGIGIPREHLVKIFDRFHRVDNRDNREIGGTGIGLYLVKSMVEAHHGSVDVQSELGKGSTFIINLPLYQPKA